MHVLQLALHSTTVATRDFVAPCDDRPIAQDGGKSITIGLDLLQALQLVLHSTAVATTHNIAPRDDRPVAQYCCEYLNLAEVQGKEISSAQPGCLQRRGCRTLPDAFKSWPGPTPRALLARLCKVSTGTSRSASREILFLLSRVTSTTTAMATNSKVERSCW